VLSYPRLVPILLVAVSVCAIVGCTRRGEDGVGDEAAGEQAAAEGDDAAVGIVQAAVRALAQPEPSVNYVAAEMEGVIKARTNSQALIQYDGYRAMLTTPGRDRVTGITFELIEARPRMDRLTEVFGKPEDVGRGMLYEYHTEATGSTIRILAEPASKPVTDTSLVRRIVIEGAPTR
jgi:hypothetical protein